MKPVSIFSYSSAIYRHNGDAPFFTLKSDTAKRRNSISRHMFVLKSGLPFCINQTYKDKLYQSNKWLPKGHRRRKLVTSLTVPFWLSIETWKKKKGTPKTRYSFWLPSPELNKCICLKESLACSFSLLTFLCNFCVLSTFIYIVENQKL